MPARNWSALSESYRRRLERAGISRSDYESGVPLSAARGHATTPERPSRDRGQTRYEKYRDKRRYLEEALYQKKEYLFGDRRQWNPQRARRNVEINPENKRPWTIQELEAALYFDDLDLAMDYDIEDLPWSAMIYYH